MDMGVQNMCTQNKNEHLLTTTNVDRMCGRVMEDNVPVGQWHLTKTRGGDCKNFKNRKKCLDN